MGSLGRGGIVLAALLLGGCERHEHAEHHEAHHRIVVTSPAAMTVISTQRYVCQIHSRRHIEVRALETGYLDQIPIREGQEVAQGELLFKIVPTIYKAKLDAEAAEVQLAQIELTNSRNLQRQNVVSPQDVALAEAKLAKAQAELELARAELNFTDVRAPFAGIVDRLLEQQGSLIEEGDVLTTLSDNAVVWAYFNVPEARYLYYKTQGGQELANLQVELVLANNQTFPQPGRIGAIEADFDSETGNIAFRADFENPDRLLRHGQTGTILIHRSMPDATVIPQRATYEILDKRYVYVVGEDGVVRQREIEVALEKEDIFVVGSGVAVGERIVLEGIRQVRDGEHVEAEFREPDEVLGHLKNEAE